MTFAKRRARLFFGSRKPYSFLKAGIRRQVPAPQKAPQPERMPQVGKPPQPQVLPQKGAVPQPQTLPFRRGGPASL